MSCLFFVSYTIENREREIIGKRRKNSLNCCCTLSSRLSLKVWSWCLLPRILGRTTVNPPERSIRSGFESSGSVTAAGSAERLVVSTLGFSMRRLYADFDSSVRVDCFKCNAKNKRNRKQTNKQTDKQTKICNKQPKIINKLWAILNDN